MLYSDLNAFERETYMLEAPETREEILLIFQAAEYMAESNWANAIVKIRKFRELPTHSHKATRGLEKEVRLMESYCLYHMNNQEEAQQILIQLLDEFELPEDRSIESQHSSHSSIQSYRFKSQKSLSVRAHTFAATIIINSEDTSLEYKDIRDRLINLLKPKQMSIYLPEVLGTLTGCKHFQPLIALQDLPGLHSPVFARKLQLIADWKFIAGLPQQAIQFKRRAQNLWELLNCRNEFMECQSQLKDLQTKKKSPYFTKLSRIKVFAEGLLKIEAPPVSNNKQTLLKWKIPILIDQILPPPTQVRPKKQSGFSQSKLQRDDEKKSLLKDIVAMSNRFYNVYKQEINSESTNLILNSKFLEEQILIVRKKMLVLVRIRTGRLRDSWKRIQSVSFPAKPILNSGVVKQKQSIYF